MEKNQKDETSLWICLTAGCVLMRARRSTKCVRTFCERARMCMHVVTCHAHQIERLVRPINCCFLKWVVFSKYLVTSSKDVIYIFRRFPPGRKVLWEVVYCGPGDQVLWRTSLWGYGKWSEGWDESLDMHNSRLRAHACTQDRQISGQVLCACVHKATCHAHQIERLLRPVNCRFLHEVLISKCGITGSKNLKMLCSLSQVAIRLG